MKNSTKTLLTFGALAVGFYFFFNKRYWDRRKMLSPIMRRRDIERYAQLQQQQIDQQG